MKRHPALIVLKALLAGFPVEVDGEDWYLEGGVFGPKRVMENGTTGEKTDVILGVDWNLSAFVKWCELMPEDTLIQMTFKNAMASMKGRGK